MYCKFNDLIGKTLSKIEQIENRELIFICNDGSKYRMFHEQHCCESVEIEDITGDFQDLIGTPIIMSEEQTNKQTSKPENDYASSTWTFYKLATVNGFVTIRWYGESNGYYSERVDFEKID